MAISGLRGRGVEDEGIPFTVEMKAHWWRGRLEVEELDRGGVRSMIQRNYGVVEPNRG